ncbi:MAG: creatininase family protein [Proteobacteria bacterium]|nr:creatininase family protein [Pseudomonadota bacterium]
MFFFTNGIIFYGILTHLIIWVSVFIEIFLLAFNGTFGPLAAPAFAVTPVSIALYTLIAVLVLDFSIYIVHYLQHRVPLLWQFHQVHHSAEVLTPITFLRMHPVDLFFFGLSGSLFGALAFAGFVYLTGARPHEITILSVNVFVFAFYLFGYNLRHSHVWLSYPRWLSHILISPAQHQTHHSVEAKHFDRNMGLIFAFWDWIFGTLYVATRYERLTYGLNRTEPNPFRSVTDIYLMPFRNAWALIAPGSGRGRALLATALAAAVGLYLVAYQSTRMAGAAQYAPPSVHLEDLTWTEVRQALDNGYDSVIVPTGGTEQNGPYVILGKHNDIVRQTAGEIARRLGHTLVAPVIAYVPEGDPGAAPSGHMRFSGTLTVPEAAFEAILAAAVDSYRTHGFKTIYFIGDSGGNQEAQARVAAAMTEGGDGAPVYQIGDYYAANGQIEWLEQQGFSRQRIGAHAGIRDTSELLAVNPDGVRRTPVPRPADAPQDRNGDHSAATPEIGRKMLELKIEAAIRQIRALQRSR